MLWVSVICGPSICRALSLIEFVETWVFVNTTVFPPIGLQRMGKQKWCGTSSTLVTKHDVSADILLSICSGLLETGRTHEYLLQHHCGWSSGKLKSITVIYVMLGLSHFYLIMWRCIVTHAMPYTLQVWICCLSFVFFCPLQSLLWAYIAAAIAFFFSFMWT